MPLILRILVESDATSRRSSARCTYAELCLDRPEGKGLGLAGARVPQAHEGLVSAGAIVFPVGKIEALPEEILPLCATVKPLFPPSAFVIDLVLAGLRRIPDGFS